jgi:hypothetical protein
VVEALGDHEDRIRYENTRQKLAAGITKKRRKYEPRVFDGRVIMSDEIERIPKEVLKFERIEGISDPMRELIEDLWPELVRKLPPKQPQAEFQLQPLNRSESSLRL